MRSAGGINSENRRIPPVKTYLEHLSDGYNLIARFAHIRETSM